MCPLTMVVDSMEYKRESFWRSRNRDPGRFSFGINLLEPCGVACIDVRVNTVTAVGSAG